MNMNYYPQLPNYYRSHHYAHQFNLPDSALQNRKIPVYTSEMPQGVDPFLHSHKKHFQRAGYRSIIAEQNIINHQSPQETNSPAKNKDYYRNLSIDDIEGATPNTLISQAIKNRIKAKQHFLRRQRECSLQDNTYSNRYASGPQQSSQQGDALRLLKQSKKEENYHQRMRVKTENYKQMPSSKFHVKQIDKANQFRGQIQETQKQIEELQRRLKYVQQKASRQKIGLDIPMKEQEKRKATNFQRQNIQPNSYLKLPKIKVSQQSKDQINLNQQRNTKSGQRGQLKKRSYTQPNENQYQIYNLPDKIEEQNVNIQQGSHEHKLSQSRLRRQEIRKMNPTYLSYGSFALSNNAKKVYF